MAYVTQAQLTKRFASVKWWTDDDASGAVDADIVTEAIALAAAEIDAAASQHFTTPLALGNATTAAIIKDRAGTVAGYKLATRRHELSPDDPLALEFERVREWLKELAAGNVRLAGEAVISADKPGGGIVLAGGDAVVTRETMDGL